jgi:hypothetical protein
MYKKTFLSASKKVVENSSTAYDETTPVLFPPIKIVV